MSSVRACERIARVILPYVKAALMRNYDGAKIFPDEGRTSTIYVRLPNGEEYDITIWDKTPERFKKEPDEIGTWYSTAVDGVREIRMIEKPEDM